ncbi:MAG: Rpn family recombination-promoting nuclease/putative transposase [Gammaproteobacteria bacterium]
MPPHDHSYKLLFSHPQMVRDLLEGFVREDWLAQLDYSSLEKVNGSYVTGDLRARTSDMVWRVRWGADWIYIYLLIEFQSKVERYMAVRIAAYVTLLYQDLIKAKQVQSDGRLPPVLPVVLYNGQKRWNAALQLSELIQSGPHALEAYAPRMRYLLVDERRYRHSAQAPLRNLVAALFRLESSQTTTELQSVLRSVIEWMRSPEQASLKRAFSTWLKKVILPRLSHNEAANVTEFEEMQVMLSETIKRWKAEYRSEGLKEGRRRCDERLVLRQIHKRFGEVPHWAAVRVQSAQLEQLESWLEKLLDGASIDDCLGRENADLLNGHANG